MSPSPDFIFVRDYSRLLGGSAPQQEHGVGCGQDNVGGEEMASTTCEERDGKKKNCVGRVVCLAVEMERSNEGGASAMERSNEGGASAMEMSNP